MSLTTHLLKLVALTAAMPACVMAQSWEPASFEVPIGSPLANGTELKPFHARWSATSATLTDQIAPLPAREETLEPVTYGGRDAWRRTLIVGDAPNRVATQTNFLDRKTMAPLLTDESHTDGTQLVIAFDNDRIKGRQKRDANSPPRDIDSASLPSFDFLNGPAALILAAMPLAPNTEFSFPILDVDGPNPGHVITIAASVRAAQTVTVGDRTFDTFIVDVPTHYGLFKYWIARTPPYAIQWIYLGPRGGRALYKLDPSTSS
jgi:hypothetical protein